ncbi:MAG TPA: hypothetical protein VFW45_14370 [Candidatus Polarisedimenticolia bacterium]|nr:hypothetical protein [Candidatus Polarisedimenticolia bacterium]
MKRTAMLAMIVLSMMGAMGCASHHETVQSVQVPPRVNLKEHEIIGVVEFSSSSKGKLGPLATSRFIEMARRDQGLVRIVSLGTEAEALRSVLRDRLDAEALRVLGEKHGVQSIFTGKVTVSDIKPNVQLLTSLRGGHVSAQVNATLAVQLIETSTGASLWSSSAQGAREVGQISVSSGRNFSFDSDDPDQAYGDLVNALASETTRDFQVTWERR